MKIKVKFIYLILDQTPGSGPICLKSWQKPTPRVVDMIPYTDFYYLYVFWHYSADGQTDGHSHTVFA